MGSTPTGPTKLNNSDVALMVEQAAVNRKVRGSSPRVGAKLEGTTKWNLLRG